MDEGHTVQMFSLMPSVGIGVRADLAFWVKWLLVTQQIEEDNQKQRPYETRSVSHTLLLVDVHRQCRQ